MQSKKVTQSKTIWFNLLSAVSVGLTMLLAEPSFTELLGGGAIVALNIVNIILRKYTSVPLEPITKKKEPPPSNIVEKHEEILTQSDDNYISRF